MPPKVDATDVAMTTYASNHPDDAVPSHSQTHSNSPHARGASGAQNDRGNGNTTSSVSIPALPESVPRKKANVLLQQLQPRADRRTIGVVAGALDNNVTTAHGPTSDAVATPPLKANAVIDTLSRFHRDAAMAKPFDVKSHFVSDAEIARGQHYLSDRESVRIELSGWFGNVDASQTTSPNRQLIDALFPPMPRHGQAAAVAGSSAAGDAIPAAERLLPMRALLGASLSVACQGDAERALRVLNAFDRGDDGHSRGHSAASSAAVQDPRRPRLEPRTKDDLFTTERLLAASGLGLDVLHEGRLCTPAASQIKGKHAVTDASVPPTSPAHEELQVQAETAAYEAAHRLLEKWPADVQRPASLHEMALVCNTLHQSFHASRLPGDIPEHFLAPQRHDDRASLLENSESRRLCDALLNSRIARDPIATKGLLAAYQIKHDPSFNLARHPDLQLPFLAARNHVFDESQLHEVGERLFKVLEYADRAAAPMQSSFKSVLDFVLGRHKNPLHALNRGTAGQMLREPEEDFAHIHAGIGMLIDKYRLDVENTPVSSNPSPNTVRTVLRAATLAEWDEQIGQHGWRDVMPMRPLTDALPLRHGAMDRIAERAADALGMPVETLKTHPAFATHKDDSTMSAGTFRRWANDAGMVDAMQQEIGTMNRMVNRGDGDMTMHTGDDRILMLRNKIAGARMTYPIRFTDTKQRGINFNPYTTKGLPKGPPVVALGPIVRAVHTRSAAVNSGSNALAGAFEVTSARGMGGTLGIGSIATWRLGNFSPTLGLSLVPAIGDHTTGEGAALRTRLHGTDPTLWSRTLLSAFDAMYGVSADQGTVSRPTDSTALLQRLANAHHADPYLSFGPMSTRTTTIGHAITPSAALRGKAEKARSAARGGLAMNATTTVQSYVDRRTKDHAGVLSTQTVNRSANVSVTTSAGAGSSIPAVGSFIFPALNFGSTQAVIVPQSTSSTVRFAQENGKIAPTTIVDTEFAEPSDFMGSMASRRDAWMNWTDSHGSQASNDLDRALARMADNAETGKVLMAERVIMQSPARERLDLLLAMRAMAEHAPGNAVSRQQRVASANAGIQAVIHDPGSLGPRFLYTIESNSNQTIFDLSYMAEVTDISETSTARQLNAYRADATPGDPRGAI